METIEQKLNYIIEQINATPNFTPHISSTKVERVNYYKDMKHKLSEMQPEKITAYDFQREVIIKAENLEKVYMAEKLLHFLTGIETHAYAPELNTAHFCGYEIKCSGVINNSSLLAYLSTKPFSLLEAHFVEICRHINKDYANNFLSVDYMAEHYNVLPHAINRALTFVSLNNL